MRHVRLFAVLSSCALVADAPLPAQTVRREAPVPAPAAPLSAPAAVVSAPISDVRYEVAFDRAAGARAALRVTMSMTVTGRDPVVLSLPAWTPGAYEIGNFAHWVRAFGAAGDGTPLDWDKVDFDTWRIDPAGARRVTVRFDYGADTLDNAMAWSRPDFALFNGTNVFLYPEGRGTDFAATVAVKTEPQWKVATGLRATAVPDEFTASDYHELVDAPFFVGAFDLDSLRMAGKWMRLATYPAGSVAGQTRRNVYRDVSRFLPAEQAVFGETPWDTYTIMQITDSTFGGGSGLEHGNSHVDIYAPYLNGTAVASSIYAHEIFHSWNVKRLRPADMTPYRYDRPQPTTWLWVSEGITDYYADLVEARGGVIDSAAFFKRTAGKIDEVGDVPPVALEDASLSTWVHPSDGTGYLYYPKGSLAGLMLDVLIRDASDNRRSLDDVMRELYRTTYRQGSGFTPEQWWGAVSRASSGRIDVVDFNRRYIDGREPYPWDRILPLAGMQLVADTVRDPQLGVLTLPDSAGMRVAGVEPGSAAEEAGVRPGDVLVSIGDIPVTDGSFGVRFRMKYGKQEGAALPIRVRRDGAPLVLPGRVRFTEKISHGIRADRGANEKAVRVRNGLMRGTVERDGKQ
jgi:predicted metalloprotease with PDZ domain